MSELKRALSAAKITIVKYDSKRARPIFIPSGAIGFQKFCKMIQTALGPDLAKYPEVFSATFDISKMDGMFSVYARSEGLLPDENGDGVTIPDELAQYTLNVNISARRGEDEFFLTTRNEFISRISGKYYISRCRIPPLDAFSIARPVVPSYMPRKKPGITIEEDVEKSDGSKLNMFNTYIPPDWVLWRHNNPKEWDALPAKAPVLFLKMVKHLIPSKIERQYLYAWIYTSLTERCYVYLVLCGAPGSGKNRLKLALRALHGRSNSIDGKKSTLTERFNSQLSQGTLTWFDELKYDSDMENTMKEIQNDYVSIERKGIDATLSSTIYSSMVISNNKPRDNYIEFNSRKFVPLVLANSNLQKSMTVEEIDAFTRKVEHGKPDYDESYVAQIAKWIISIGKPNAKKWEKLEYQGPMFWALAHTSMTKWQKRAVTILVDKKTGGRIGWDEQEGAHVWSKVEEKLNRKKEEGVSILPEYSTVQSFFDVFKDSEGRQAFSTKPIPGDLLKDFWIYPLIEKITIVTEGTVAQQRAKGKLNEEKEDYDL